MTSNAELIAQFRSEGNEWSGKYGRLFFRAADAVEASEKRAAEAERERDSAMKSYADYMRIRRERDQLAAVVEKVRVRLTTDLDANDESHVSDALTILASAPDDALREVKAAVWDEGFDVGYEDQRNRDTGVPMPVNPYREE